VVLATADVCMDGNRALRLLGGVSERTRIEPVRYTIPVPVRGFGFGILPSDEELGNRRRCCVDEVDGGGLEGVEAFRFRC
jgi:hypothetical protein